MPRLSKANLAFNAIVEERNEATNIVFDALVRVNAATRAAREIDKAAANALRWQEYDLTPIKSA